MKGDAITRRRTAALLLCLAWGLIAVPAAGAAGKRILAIHSFHAGYTWQDALNRSLQLSLAASHSQPQVFHEYLDTLRHPDPALQVAFAQFLQAKYGNLRPDLIIATGNAALYFLLNYRNWLFGDTPVVFSGVVGFSPYLLRGEANYTGVKAEPDLLGTLQAALKLFPRTRSLVVYGTWNPDYFDTMRLLSQARDSLDRPLQIKKRENWRISRILQDAAALPSGSLILFLSQVLDDQGRLMSAERSSAMIAPARQHPFLAVGRFCWGTAYWGAG